MPDCPIVDGDIERYSRFQVGCRGRSSEAAVVPTRNHRARSSQCQNVREILPDRGQSPWPVRIGHQQRPRHGQQAAVEDRYPLLIAGVGSQVSRV